MCSREQKLMKLMAGEEGSGRRREGGVLGSG